ncbi:MAG: hypothetical protein MPEBLZ_04525, partial [Candidatus Methanoperedens nitroreducens]
NNFKLFEAIIMAINRLDYYIYLSLERFCQVEVDGTKSNDNEIS